MLTFPAIAANTFYLCRMNRLMIVFLLASLASCSASRYSIYEQERTDYADERNWAALPALKDKSDLCPAGLPAVKDAPVDVFFIHPTSFNNKNDHQQWNASLAVKKINKHTDRKPIKYQASIFNQAGQVYAPRYRQTHLKAYFTQDTSRARRAFDLAYRDVRDAFLYYLEHYNSGRPIIIASHSQGTTHGMRLMKEFFDGTPLQKKLVVAYLAGIPVPRDYFDHIPACDSPEAIGCVNSWRTFEYGYEPRFLAGEKPMIVTNPISWRADTGYVDKSLHKGAVLWKFNGPILQQIADACIYKNILWVHKPKFPWSFVYKSKNYHIADYNFFYMDVRDNAILRRDMYMKRGEE